MMELVDRDFPNGLRPWIQCPTAVGGIDGLTPETDTEKKRTTNDKLSFYFNRSKVRLGYIARCCHKYAPVYSQFLTKEIELFFLSKL